MASEPTGEVSICNLALDHLAEDAITVITPPVTETEKACARAYPLARRLLLTKHPWNFARKRVLVARSGSVPAFDFSDKYPQPDDCLRVLWLQDATGKRYHNDDFDYEGRDILVDSGGASPIQLYYVADITEVKLWSATFTDLLVLLLASKLAFKIAGKKSEVQRLDALFDKDYAEAMSINAMERPPHIIDSQPTLTARRNAGRGDSTRFNV